MNEAVQHVEELVKKKASTLSEEEKRELKEFSKVFNPRLEQMEKNVNTAKIVVGRNKDPSFNEFAKATAGLKRLLRVCRQNLQIVRLFYVVNSRMRKKYYSIIKRQLRRESKEETRTVRITFS